MRFKDLEDIGVFNGPYNCWVGKHSRFKDKLSYIFRIKNRIKWFFQRRKYGIDSRWCYSLDDTFYQLLYVGLIRFKKDASDIVDLGEAKYTYKEETHSLDYWIDRILEDIRYFYHYDEYLIEKDMTKKEREAKLEEDLAKMSNWLVKTEEGKYTINSDNDSYYDMYYKRDIEDEERKKEVREIFCLILPALWW